MYISRIENDFGIARKNEHDKNVFYLKLDFS
ncbi:hypothetical protein FLAV_01858 [Flavobacteriales bacterium]|nr:hypothetical protein [Flavobacteriales bacterium]CAG0982754.1 hypothetical protein FLAV_01858 [Flavobacteriales bacterium]